MEADRTPNGVVVLYSGDERHYACEHERATRTGIARRLATLKDFEFGGMYEASARYPAPLYFVPSDTLVGQDLPNELGIRDEHDLFGGVVPFAFVATKALTHPLTGPDARAPAGWSREFGRRVRDAVHAGWSVFSIGDARHAGLHLLEKGPVRLKPVRATGGLGQVMVRAAAELDAALDAMEPSEVEEHGLVLEEHLTDVVTFSVGQVRVSDLVVTYHGTQQLTRDNTGKEVYGGSRLVCARGGFEALLGLDLAEDVRLAMTQARIYDAATAACFPELIASRRNYDVLRGLDGEGRQCSGVFEQSWRIGGASGAEVAALEAFRTGPALRTVRASTIEAYGDSVPPPPPHATVYFRGVDGEVGPITKYAMVESYGDA
jgi:hypothetical protein